MAQDIILETRKLSKDFGGIKAVRQVDFALREGEIRSIIGPNGAGKTTFFNLLAGKIKLTSGAIIYRKKDISKLPQHKVCRLGITKSHQITSIFPLLSVFENVRIAAQMRFTCYNFWGSANGLPEVNARTETILEQVGLIQKREMVADSLPYGDQRYLEIAITLATEPDILLLDEPTAGMTPVETADTVKLVQKLAKDLTIVIVEHDMSVVMGISHHITVLHDGSILAEGSPEEIHHNSEVQRVYLGGH
ncbi:MAG: ABC transporter ATP-binding protein [Deltaproteobacteria bacterium]|nr:ABC transporter ATP-binding protein [Deltaproteobacteria bacterium]